MPVGTDVGFPGNAAPLTGDFEMINRVAATDHVTLTAAASNTGKHVVCRTSGGTERFSVGANGAVTITSGAAADSPLLVQQAASPTSFPIQVQNSSGSRVFALTTAGGIRTMVLSTFAVASVASNASTSFTLTGATTDDACIVIPLKTLTTGNGVLQAFVGTADRVDVFAEGGSVAANTYAAWIFRTVSNSA